jgi:Sulfatase-modifying factor enzyme 1
VDQSESEVKKAPTPKKHRQRLSVSIFLAIVFLVLILHRCYQENPPPQTTLPPPIHSGRGNDDSLTPILPESTLVAESTTMDTNPPHPTDPSSTSKPAANPPLKPVQANPALRIAAPVDSGPYIYADPWGGRHFDSVTVALHCREGCVILYSFEDSVHFKSYEQPFLFRRNTTLWLSGIDSLNRQATPIRVDYVIERNPGACAQNSMPMVVQGKAVCMDIYEWPNREGEIPAAFVSQKDAGDSCRQAGKRLCTDVEWKEGCQGPDRVDYPYGSKYNENHCPAKEPGAARSGRNPVCRSYYGIYDLTGNLWEWTSTPAKSDNDFYMVVGGNWDTGNDATCRLAKFSFYPSVRYPFVGFRCCQDIVAK